MVIETSANQFYRVKETKCPDLQHVWYGVAVKRTREGFVDKKNAHETLIRKDCCRVVEA